MSALTGLFERTRGEDRAALIGYLPAGFPSADGCVEAITAMAAGGVDAIEVGLPYSDPVLDGPTIQRAAERALAAGTRTVDVLRTVERVAGTGLPTVVMTYWNPVERYGVDAFARDLAAAGGVGVITPDLIPDEADLWLAASDRAGLDRVFLVSPSTPDDRITRAADATRGFLYATSVMGVTGVRDRASGAAPTLVARVRALSDVPVGVGLGVRDGAQAAEVAAYADAVIVGSAFVHPLLDPASEAGAIARVRDLAGDLAGGVRRHPGTRGC